ncbi:MAG: hypothetical protein ACPG4T_12830 [Nannocystaceae bacterium]
MGRVIESRSSKNGRVTAGHLAAVFLTFAAVACDPGGQTIPAPDPDLFVQTVYPVLLRDCSFPACHGNPSRPLFIPGPGRTRLSEESELFDAPTADEINVAYARTRGLLGSSIEVDGEPLPILLEKTLSHAGHAGRDRHGNNVYEHRDTPGWSVLRDWAAP